MALTQRSRTVLYQRLTDTIEGEVAVGELLSYFPARDVEEPASTEFVAAQIAGLRGDVRSDVAALASTMHAEVGELRLEVAAMEARIIAQVAEQGRTMMRWTVGLVMSFAGLAVSLVGLVVAMGLIQRP